MISYNDTDLITTSEAKTTTYLPSLGALMSELMPTDTTTSPAEPYSVYCHIALPKLPAGDLKYRMSCRIASFATLREAVGMARLYQRVAKEHGLANLTYEVLVSAAMIEGV